MNEFDPQLALGGDLELVPDKDLCVELLRRHEHGVIVGLKPGYEAPDCAVLTMMAVGDRRTIVQLLQSAAIKILQGNE